MSSMLRDVADEAIREESGVGDKTASDMLRLCIEEIHRRAKEDSHCGLSTQCHFRIAKRRRLQERIRTMRKYSHGFGSEFLVTLMNAVGIAIPESRDIR